MKQFRRIAVYCGSSNQADARYFELARSVGRHLAESGVGVVYGGGRVGLMGAMADAAIDAGGQVIGVIPERLQALEIGHAGLDELYVVDSMPARKAMMIYLSDAYIALPGGFGTLEEIIEVATLAMLGYHHKPLGLLNAFGYFDHLLAWIEHAAEEKFVRPPHRTLLQTAPDIAGLIEKLRVAETAAPETWVGR